MIQTFIRVIGVAAPMMKENIDTDAIIPAKHLVGHEREELAAFAFEAYRYRPDRTDNPDFILNQLRYRGAQILIAGGNFGCGSSRESAVWALAGLGIRCIIAPSFGDIFINNAFQNGMLLISLPSGQVQKLAVEIESSATPTMTVDLQRLVIVSPLGAEVPFAIDAERRQALLEGHDEIGMTLTQVADIFAFQKRDREVRPWVYQTTLRGSPRRRQSG
jgi:3-isopropylmalate/(R)-2-methylmalate dehydratase small subunit